MQRRTIGKVLLSVILAATAIISDFVDWNETHLFNPDWPPHAIFHDVVLLGFLTIFCGMGLWLLWRRNKEPNLGPFIAMMVPCAFWGMFFVAAVFPGSSPSTHPEEPPPLAIASIPIYPNMLLAAVIVPLSVFAYWLIRAPSSSTDGQGGTTPD